MPEKLNLNEFSDRPVSDAVLALAEELADGEAVMLLDVAKELDLSRSTVQQVAKRARVLVTAFQKGQGGAKVNLIANLKTAEQWAKRSKTKGAPARRKR